MPSAPALPAATDDDVLVQRLLARDEHALRLLQARYGNSLSGVIRRLVRDEVLAQDVLQEGLLKVWLGIASYDAERSRLFTWMARICTNHAVDMLRSPRHRFHRKNPSLDVDSAQQAPAASTFEPEHIGVRELTLSLKPKQREVIDLLYFGGYTQSQAAERLGIPLATVKTRARAALQVLAKVVR